MSKPSHIAEPQLRAFMNVHTENLTALLVARCRCFLPITPNLGTQNLHASIQASIMHFSHESTLTGVSSCMDYCFEEMAQIISN